MMSLRENKVIDLNTGIQSLDSEKMPVAFHSSYENVYARLMKWRNRFPHTTDETLFHDLLLFYLLASKKHVEHKTELHLFRLVLSLHFLKKKLLRNMTSSSHQKHTAVKWLPSVLHFHFSEKTVMGLLIGHSFADRYEIFDEENVILALKKFLPDLQLVKGSYYSHNTLHEDIHLSYFEIEKTDSSAFSLAELNLLKAQFEDKVKQSIQKLSPAIFMGINHEETYKNTLILSQEIEELDDPPQVHISLSHQTGKEIVFFVNLVQVSLPYHFSIEEKFMECRFVSEGFSVVKHLEDQPIEAHLFYLYIPRTSALLRSDGSLNFSVARQKVVSLIEKAIGNFRDYNGGILAKQREQFLRFQDKIKDLYKGDEDLLENFFFGLTPLEKQVVISTSTLKIAFELFLKVEKRVEQKQENYLLDSYEDEKKVVFVAFFAEKDLKAYILEELRNLIGYSDKFAYNSIESKKGIFFNCTYKKSENTKDNRDIVEILGRFENWKLKFYEKQTLRIGIEHEIVSPDPRIGGEGVSVDVLKFLFEGLTRTDQYGRLENAIARSIEISSCRTHYTFHLRPSSWNDGSHLTAYDFEYAWKSVLSPSFETRFGYFFFHIKNAQKAKEGLVSPDEIGVRAIDELTLQVDLEFPTPFFLQLLAHPLFSPIHREMDQKHPQWPFHFGVDFPCNGPFLLKKNLQGKGLQLIKNPNYWQSSIISLDQITLNYMSASQALTSFQRRELDWIGNPFGSWHSSYNDYVDNNPKSKLVTISDAWVCWCVLNTSAFPFHNKKIRQAISLAFDRSEIVSNAFISLNPAYSLLLPRQKVTSQFDFPSRDPEKAKKLFREGLAELGLDKKDIKSFRITFYEKGIREYTAYCLKRQIEEVLEVNCELQSLSWKETSYRLTKGKFDIGIMHWYSWIDDPIYLLNSFRSLKKEELNMSQWVDEEFENYLKLSDRESNPFKRADYLLRAEKILRNEIPAIPLFYQSMYGLQSSKLNGIFTEPNGSYNLTKTFIKKET